MDFTEVYRCLGTAGLFIGAFPATATCSSSPSFHTSLHAPLCSGISDEKPSERRPRPMGNTIRFRSRLTACAGHSSG